MSWNSVLLLSHILIWNNLQDNVSMKRKLQDSIFELHL